MTSVFLTILNMGITASWLMIAVFILRFVLFRTPKWILCMLWALVAVRLICPFTLKSALSLIPRNPLLFETSTADSSSPANAMRQIQDTTAIEKKVIEKTAIEKKVIEKTAIEKTAENSLARENIADKSFQSGTAAQPDKETDILSFLSIIWAAGTAIMAIYSLVSYRKLYQHTRASMPLYENVMICDGIDVPFVFGMIRPRIYLPSSLEDTQAKYVIAHEKAHITRLDHWWKTAGFFILSIYWFHPLCWISYILFSRDIETACDEHVVKTFSFDDKKNYAKALLTYSIKPKTVTAYPLSFGEIGAAERIRAVLHYKKPALWIIFVSLVICMITAACFLTDPASRTMADTSSADRMADAQPEFSDHMKHRQQVKDSKKTLLQDMLETWTQAFVKKDGKTIAALASAKLKSELKNAELLTGHEGNYSFGFTSPWPLNDSTDCRIEDYNSSQAKIYYYARTSEPHITVWKETLDYEWDGTQYVVTGEMLSCYDSISSGAEFEDAYQFAIDGSMMDYTQNDLGKTLQDLALLSSSYIYRDLFSPETAAIHLLNLSPEDVKITRAGENTSRMIGLNLTFPSDEATIAISMIRPYDDTGIWVPADNKIDVIQRFMDVNWEDIKNLPLTEPAITDTKNILCIGELPEDDIKIYGYNDDDISLQGVAVYLKGDVSYYDWTYSSTHGILPTLYWEEEHSQLQIAFHIYTGTGVSADSLYILQRNDAGALVPYHFGFDDYRAQLEKRIGYTFSEESRILTLIDRKTEKELASTELPEGTITGIELGLISSFQLGETITYQVTPGYQTDGGAMAQYDYMPTLEFDLKIITDENGSISFDFGNGHNM